MAQIPVFKFKDISFEAPLTKLNRDKIYGWSEKKYTDDNNKPCNFYSILDDGNTLVGTGGVSLKSVDATGNEIDKSTLVAHFQNGDIATLIPSVFEKENILSTDKTLQDYLSMDIKSVYQINVADKTKILEALKEHKVLYFPFNYRAGYDPDDAFLIAQAENIFIITGSVNNFEFSSLSLPVVFEEETEEEDSDEIDFSMF